MLDTSVVWQPVQGVQGHKGTSIGYSVVWQPVQGYKCWVQVLCDNLYKGYKGTRVLVLGTALCDNLYKGTSVEYKCCVTTHIMGMHVD